MTTGATSVCVASDKWGLQVYFIGGQSDEYPYGITQATRYDDDDALAGMYPEGSGNIVLYSGANPVPGAALTISYLADDEPLHFATYTWDSYYKKWKPYIVVIDSDNSVKIWKWDYDKADFVAFKNAM